MFRGVACAAVLLLLLLLRSDMHIHVQIIHVRNVSSAGMHAVQTFYSVGWTESALSMRPKAKQARTHADDHHGLFLSETALSACPVPVLFTRRLRQKRHFLAWGGR